MQSFRGKGAQRGKRLAVSSCPSPGPDLPGGRGAVYWVTRADRLRRPPSWTSLLSREEGSQQGLGGAPGGALTGDETPEEAHLGAPFQTVFS